MSVENVKFVRILENGTKMVNKYYRFPLLFRNANIPFLNNRCQALQRLSHVQKSYKGNNQFQKVYIRFIEEIMSKGYARKSTRQAAPRKIWHLVHHCFYYPNKPEKIRVQFDLSVHYKGIYITRELLSGQDFTNRIGGVLFRFKEGQVAIMGKIEAMFHQVKVLDDQCNFRRFLQWNDCDIKKEIIKFEMTAHEFGGHRRHHVPVLP